jgi:hypothetical protein
VAAGVGWCETASQVLRGLGLGSIVLKDNEPRPEFGPRAQLLGV